MASGQSVTVTGNGFIPGRTPNGTSVLDGFGVLLPLPGQFGVTSGAVRRSDLDGAGTDLGHRDGYHQRPGAGGQSQPVAVTGPDANGAVTATVDTTGLGRRHVHGDDHRFRADPADHVQRRLTGAAS